MWDELDELVDWTIEDIRRNSYLRTTVPRYRIAMGKRAINTMKQRGYDTTPWEEHLADLIAGKAGPRDPWTRIGPEPAFPLTHKDQMRNPEVKKKAASRWARWKSPL